MKNKTMIYIIIFLMIFTVPAAGIFIIAGGLSVTTGNDFGNKAPIEEAAYGTGATSACNSDILTAAKNIFNSYTVNYSMEKRNTKEGSIYYLDCSSFVDIVYKFSTSNNSNKIAENYETLGLRKLGDSEQRLPGDIIVYHLKPDGKGGYEALKNAGHVMIYESEDASNFYVSEVSSEGSGSGRTRNKEKVLGEENGYVGTFRYASCNK